MPEYISVSIPKSTKKLLESLAKEKGISLQQLIRDYLASGMSLDNFIKKGGKVELIIPSRKVEE